MNVEIVTSVEILEAEIRMDLIRVFGPIIGGVDLSKSLGYRSLDAMRQAICRKTIPIPVFEIKKRKGKFALTQDVARWIAQSSTNGNRSKHDEQRVEV